MRRRIARATALSPVSSVALRAHRQLSSSFCLSHASGVSRAGPVYITFDLDALDPTVAPGVSNLEPGEQGFLVDDAMELLRSVRGMNLVGGDVAGCDLALVVVLSMTYLVPLVADGTRG